MGRNSKSQKLVLDGYGRYLKTRDGCFVVRNKDSEKKYPILEQDLGELVLYEGNVVTTRALALCSRWNIDVMLANSTGEPMATLKSLDDDPCVETRIQQYRSLENGKGLYLAKQLLLGKLEGQSLVLRKYGLEPLKDYAKLIESFREKDLNALRKRLLHIEGKYADHYFREVFSLFPEKIRPITRVSYLAFVGLNNVFNLTYTILRWKCYRAISKSHLEPYLGYLHTHLVQYRPSLVCDFMELYRHVIDGFLIENCSGLTTKDFKYETVWIGRKNAKRMYLKDELASELVDNLYRHFTKKVRVNRIKNGKQQELETLLNEEALLLAQYLRNERQTWIPRIANLD